MGNTDRNIELRALPITSVESVLSLRLLEHKGRPAMLISRTGPQSGSPRSQTIIFRFDPSTPDLQVTELFTIPQLLPAPPQWDVGGKGEAWFAVVQQAGGAISALKLHTGKSEPSVVTQSYPLRDFSHPRFVGGGAPALTAVVDNKLLVVFVVRTPTESAKYMELGEADDGELVALQDNYVLVVKRDRSGPARQGILPGEIGASLLSNRFDKVRALPAPLGNQLVYQFSAGLIGEKAAVLTTLEEALELAIWHDKDVRRIRLAVPDDAGELLHPSMCVAGQELHLGVLASPGTPNARVLYASVPFSRVSSPDE